MSKDEMSHDHITGDFQISQKPYWKLLLQSLFLICILFVAESMVIFLVEKPKYFWIAIVGVIIAFLILKLSKLKLFQFSRITKKQWLIIIIGFILANGADYIYFEFMPTTGNEKVRGKLPQCTTVFTTHCDRYFRSYLRRNYI